MVDDPNRKSPRTFQCRDALWDSLESLAAENEQSVDYLVNEAIRAYLQAHGRSVFAPRATAAPAMPAMPAAKPAIPAMPGAPPPMPRAGGAPGAPPPIPKLPSMPGASMPPPRPSMPGVGQTLQGAGAVPGMPRMPGMPPAMPAAPPAMPGGPRMPPPMPAREKQLFATFEGQEYVVDKDEFFIGRGQKVCEVVIRDTNVSRQHAKVMKHNGAWWMLDNQSLNGVEFRGAKLQQKRIDDGDVFLICGHAIQFNFR
ncbi:MAG: FHA domain-containing protein [Polyangiales bacterium]